MLTLVIFACESDENTRYRIQVNNLSSKDMIVELSSLGINDTLFVDCLVDTLHECTSVLKSEVYIDEILAQYTDEEFESVISTLEIYEVDTFDVKTYYGDSATFANQYEHWEYSFMQDEGYSNHDYLLTLED